MELINNSECREKRHNTIPLWGKFLLVCFSSLLILSNGTLYGRYGYAQVVLPILILVICLLFVFATLFHRGILFFDYRKNLIWIISCGLVCAFVSIGSRTVPTMGHFTFLLLYSLFPLFIILCQRDGLLDIIFNYLSLLIAFLALFSSILWFLGPFLGVLKPNCSFLYTWNAKGESYETVFGYFGLLYEAQWSGFGSFLGYRNISIFGEGPVFAFYLLVALLLELFYFESPKKWRVFSYLIALFSSFSTTGWILAFGILLYNLYLRSNSSKKIRILIIFICICLCIVFCSVALLLFLGKASTSSGGIHIDDFKAGFDAWLSSPLWGNGIGNNDAIVPFMSTFRLNNTGYSNSIMFVLATGGLLYFSLWMVSFLGFYHAGRRMKIFGLFLFLVVFFSNVSYFASAAFFLAYGVSLFVDYQRGQSR